MPGIIEKMKPHALINKKSLEYLFDHLLDGFAATRQGIINLYNNKIIGVTEFVELSNLNEERLLARIKEFKIANKLVSVFFAALFTWLQIGGDDIDMRRSSRTRTGRSASRSARGRRRNEAEPITPLL